MSIAQMLIRILDQAVISGKPRVLWLYALKYCTPRQLILLVNVLAASTPEEERAFSELFVRKRNAFKDGNTEEWQEIVHSEKTQLT